MHKFIIGDKEMISLLKSHKGLFDSDSKKALHQLTSYQNNRNKDFSFQRTFKHTKTLPQNNKGIVKINSKN